MEQIARIHIERLPEGLYLATSDDVPGLVAQGRTIAETLEIARDVAKKLIELQVRHEQFDRVATNRRSLRLSVDRRDLMGRLAGLRYRDIIRKLRSLGFSFLRQAAGSHEIWHNPFNQLPSRASALARDPGSRPRGGVRE